MAKDNYVRKKTWSEVMRNAAPKPAPKKAAPKKSKEAQNNGGGKDPVKVKE